MNRTQQEDQLFHKYKSFEIKTKQSKKIKTKHQKLTLAPFELNLCDYSFALDTAEILRKTVALIVCIVFYLIFFF